MSRRILAVDDDPLTTGLLRQWLERKGFEVREENDSRRALETARAFQPEAVVLDYIMPEVNGSDVAWQLANEPALQNVLIIVYTGVVDAALRSYLPPTNIILVSKPVQPETLLALLDGQGRV